MIYYIKDAEIKQTDQMHECLDRLRFLTGRTEVIEGALGGYFQYGTEIPVELYGEGYETEIIEGSPHEENVVVDSYESQQIFEEPANDLVTPLA